MYEVQYFPLQYLEILQNIFSLFREWSWSDGVVPDCLGFGSFWGHGKFTFNKSSVEHFVLVSFFNRMMLKNDEPYSWLLNVQ